MRSLVIDDTKFKVVPAKNPEQTVLAKKIEKEYKVKVHFIRRLTKRPYYAAFVIPSKPDCVFIQWDLRDSVFNYVLFHEIRHVLQLRSKTFILYRNEQGSGQDLIRYLFDCLTCEFDADFFAIRECASRGLDCDTPSYLYSSERGLENFLASFRIYSGRFKVSRKQIKDISQAILKPLRGVK